MPHKALVRRAGHDGLQPDDSAESSSAPWPLTSRSLLSHGEPGVGILVGALRSLPLETKHLVERRLATGEPQVLLSAAPIFRIDLLEYCASRPAYAAVLVARLLERLGMLKSVPSLQEWSKWARDVLVTGRAEVERIVVDIASRSPT